MGRMSLARSSNAWFSHFFSQASTGSTRAVAVTLVASTTTGSCGTNSARRDSKPACHCQPSPVPCPRHGQPLPSLAALVPTVASALRSHPGYFGKVGMRYFHKTQQKFFCPVMNLDKIWTLVGEETRLKYASDTSGKAPVIDCVQNVSAAYRRTVPARACAAAAFLRGEPCL